MYVVSIIIPVYNEKSAINVFINALKLTLDKLTEINFKLIFVDDGSSDQTGRKASSVCGTLGLEYQVVVLSRNFGKEAAMTAGLDIAIENKNADAFIFMDADLQDPPELLPIMLKKWKDGYEIVLAQRSKRKSDPFFRRLSASCFYYVMGKLAPEIFYKDVGDFRLIDKKVAKVIKLLREKNRCMKGILSWPGFRKAFVRFERPKRSAGNSAWSTFKLFNLFANALVNFSHFPLKIWLFIGILLILSSLILLVLPISLSITLLIFLSGLQLLALGCIAFYIASIADEVRSRPLYVIDKVCASDDDNIQKDPESRHNT